MLAPLTVGAPLVPDLLNGFGTAITFQVLGMGFSLEGGAYEWNEVCWRCEIDIAVSSGSFVLTDASDSPAAPLEPGTYEIREFAGLFLFTSRGPHDFDVQIHGKGKVEATG